MYEQPTKEEIDEACKLARKHAKEEVLYGDYTTCPYNSWSELFDIYCEEYEAQLARLDDRHNPNYGL